MNIQQLREQIAALQDATLDENKNFRTAYDEGKFDALTAVDALLDSLQEEPVSEDLNVAADKYESEQQEKYKDRDNHDFDNYRDGFVDGLTLTYAAFIAGAQWQKEHLWKPADGNDLPETDREVIVLYQPYPLENNEYAVSFAHRPSKNLLIDEIEHYIPETYGKGGWSIPDVKFWLDCKLPKK